MGVWHRLDLLRRILLMFKLMCYLLCYWRLCQLYVTCWSFKWHNQSANITIILLLPPSVRDCLLFVWFSLTLQSHATQVIWSVWFASVCLSLSLPLELSRMCYSMRMLWLILFFSTSDDSKPKFEMTHRITGLVWWLVRTTPHSINV